LSNRIAALGERLNSYCSPNITDNQVNNIKYICSVKGLVSDYFGPIYLINQMPSNDSPIILSNKPIGPNGKGGVILEKEGQSSHIVVVDSEGNRTHRDFSPISGVSSSSNIETPSLTLIGDAGKSEVSIDTRGFNSSSQSGDALFIGDANNIKINVSGKDGSNGRSVERVLALSVLKGDLLGVSELARSLVDKFKSPLSETEITEPEISKEELSKSLSGISNCDDDSLLGSELSDKPGVFKVSTKKSSCRNCGKSHL